MFTFKMLDTPGTQEAGYYPVPVGDHGKLHHRASEMPFVSSIFFSIRSQELLHRFQHNFQETFSFKNIIMI